VARVAATSTGREDIIFHGLESFRTCAPITVRSIAMQHQSANKSSRASTGYRRSGSAIAGLRRTSAHRLPARSFFGGFPTPAPYTGSITRGGPVSGTLHERGHSDPADLDGSFDPTVRFSAQLIDDGHAWRGPFLPQW